MVAQFTGKKVGQISLGLLALWVASFSQSVLAQGYDMSTFDGYGPGVSTAGIAPTNHDKGWISPNFGQAQESLGAHGTAGRTSFRTGDRARDQNSGHVTGFSNTQRHGVVQNVGYQHLLLPHTSSGGLAPIFGNTGGAWSAFQLIGSGLDPGFAFSSSQLPGPMFTTPLEDPISLGNGSSVNPSTGMIFTRVGDFRAAVNPTAGLDSQIGGLNLGERAVNKLKGAQDKSDFASWW